MAEFKGVRGPHIVIVPKSTLANWNNEFARWCPSLKVSKFHGSKEERETFVREGECVEFNRMGWKTGWVEWGGGQEVSLSRAYAFVWLTHNQFSVL